MGPKTMICPTDKKNKYIIFNGGESIDICLNGLNKGIHIKNAVEKNRACSKKCIRCISNAILYSTGKCHKE